VDKLRILKEFEKMALGDTLEIDDIRLYLLFLAYCRGTNNNGAIAYRTVKDALGDGFSPSKFKHALLRLSMKNLVELVSPQPDRVILDDFIVVYRIFPHVGKEG
jgi:hypothetical protein